MKYACHKMIEAVVRHGYMDIRLHPSQSTEGAFRAGICCWHNQNNHDQGLTTSMRDQIFFVLFEEINDIKQCITSFTLPETVIGLCHIDS